MYSSPHDKQEDQTVNENPTTEQLAAEYQVNRTAALRGLRRLVAAAVALLFCTGAAAKLAVGLAPLITDPPASGYAPDVADGIILAMACVVLGAVAIGWNIARAIVNRMFTGKPLEKALHSLCLAAILAGAIPGVPVQLVAIGFAGSLIVKQFSRSKG